MAKIYKVDQKFTVAHIMADIRANDEFDKWPSHLTLLASIRDRTYRAMAGFMETVEDMEAIKVHLGVRQLGAVALYGDRHDVQVRPLVGDGIIALAVMHGMLMTRFHGKVMDPQFFGINYRPHIALDPEYVDPGEGAELCVDSLCLVRHDVGHKTIIGAEKFH